jgi:hypothetical protein
MKLSHLKRLIKQTLNEIKTTDSHGCCRGGMECQSFNDCPPNMGCSQSNYCQEVGCCKRVEEMQAQQNR